MTRYHICCISWPVIPHTSLYSSIHRTYPSSFLVWCLSHVPYDMICHGSPTVVRWGKNCTTSFHHFCHEKFLIPCEHWKHSYKEGKNYTIIMVLIMCPAVFYSWFLVDVILEVLFYNVDVCRNYLSRCFCFVGLQDKDKFQQV